MLSGDDVVYLCKLFSSWGIQIWLTGGWGIDALLGEQTRPHKDLDVFMLVDDVSLLSAIMDQEGYAYKELWSENLWAEDSRGKKIETAFFLRDAQGRELDAHALRLDEQGNGIPAWEMAEGFFFSPQDLDGEGIVVGYPVKCQSAENQMICHMGYALPEKQVPDLRRLHEKYGIAFPAEISRQLMATST